MAPQTWFALVFAFIAYRCITDTDATEHSRGVGALLGWAALMLWATA